VPHRLIRTFPAEGRTLLKPPDLILGPPQERRGVLLVGETDADEIAHLLKSVGEKPLPLAEWAETLVGAALVGTTIEVTKRYDS
jgi:hypothetical protein